ncbi:hypothetical protein UlMin_019229 [Ulmus minor]
MASSKQFMSLAITVVLLPSIVMATEYIVGDDKGWTTSFDYQAWAKDKAFRVGDTLVFKYKAPNHNVYKVDGSAFNSCNPSSDAEMFTSGNDKIELKTSGNQWYLCGKEGHCSTGQKLKITVLDSTSQPAPSAAARVIVSSACSQVFVAALVLLMASFNIA